MATFALIPGAGGVAWYWHRVAALLEAAGHGAIAVDLPGDDPAAGLPEYADLVAAAVGERRDMVVVAQSLGGFTAPLVAERIAPRALVLVNAMVPAPGEMPRDWGRNTGSEAARRAAARERGDPDEIDLETCFLHDVPREVLASGESLQRDEADTAFASACAFTAWPDVPVRVVAGADDRLFPADFQRRVARERLGVDADVLPGGHLIALSRPRELAAYLLAFGPLGS
jgi:pimeloyl-ACP methyl ester carboxylesterase